MFMLRHRFSNERLGGGGGGGALNHLPLLFCKSVCNYQIEMHPFSSQLYQRVPFKSLETKFYSSIKTPKFHGLLAF